MFYSKWSLIAASIVASANRESCFGRRAFSLRLLTVGLGGWAILGAVAHSAPPPPPPPDAPPPRQTPPPQGPPPKTAVAEAPAPEAPVAVDPAPAPAAPEAPVAAAPAPEAPAPEAPVAPTPAPTPPAPEAPVAPVPAPPTPAPPTPAPPATPGAPALSKIAQLGQALFFNPALSNPQGISCSTCHSPPAGWTFSNSEINLQYGTVPGAVDGRFGNRRPPTISYASYMREGPPTFVADLFSYAGGFFYDGRAADLADQVPSPLENPNEMNNTPTGVVAAVASGPDAQLFQSAYGVNISTLSVDDAFVGIVGAIVAYESSPVLSPFSSKYDRWVAGEAQLSRQELAGLQLFTGSLSGRPGGPAAHKSANCVICHSIPATAGESPDLFTANTFNNTGIPKNPDNPYYDQTNATEDPLGYNPLGAAYIDYGLGDFLYPQASLPDGNIGAGSNGDGDYLKINGAFKTPTVRNVDTRPDTDFVKCYGHNGFFKSLAQVVHFYNTRNLTTVRGEVIDFTKPHPYAGLRGKPLWPEPENPWPDTLVNPTGARDGLIGNLGLTPQQEADLVAFLQTLSDAPPPAQ